MALQRVKTIFDGRWIKSSRYIDYRILDIYVPVSSSFQEFVNCIQRRLFLNSKLSISRLTVYRTDCNNFIQVVDDKDVSWIMLVIMKFSDNDLHVVVDTVSLLLILEIPRIWVVNYLELILKISRICISSEELDRLWIPIGNRFLKPVIPVTLNRSLVLVLTSPFSFFIFILFSTIYKSC